MHISIPFYFFLLHKYLCAFILAEVLRMEYCNWQNCQHDRCWFGWILLWHVLYRDVWEYSLVIVCQSIRLVLHCCLSRHSCNFAAAGLVDVKPSAFLKSLYWPTSVVFNCLHLVQRVSFLSLSSSYQALHSRDNLQLEYTDCLLDKNRLRKHIAELQANLEQQQRELERERERSQEQMEQSSPCLNCVG